MSSTARILAPTGSLASLAVVERDDWNGGRCVLFNREAWSDARQRPELINPGVYVLIGGGTAYVGEGDPVIDRLSSHNLNRQFWSRAFALTSHSGQLNKAHVQYLEATLCTVLAEHYVLENKVAPTVPCLSEFDRVWITQTLATALDMLKCFGFLESSHPFVQVPSFATAPVAPSQRQNLGGQILHKILSIPCSGSATVRDILALCDAGQHEFGKQLEAIGLKYAPGIGLLIPAGARTPKSVTLLFKNTLLASSAWESPILKLEGVKHARPRIAGEQVRSIAIPLSVCSTHWG